MESAGSPAPGLVSLRTPCPSFHSEDFIEAGAGFRGSANGLRADFDTFPERLAPEL